ATAAQLGTRGELHLGDDDDAGRVTVLRADGGAVALVRRIRLVELEDDYSVDRDRDAHQDRDAVAWHSVYGHDVARARLADDLEDRSGARDRERREVLDGICARWLGGAREIHERECDGYDRAFHGCPPLASR